MDSLLNDDDEDWLKATPSSFTKTAADDAPAKKRQKKVLNLDDLLALDQKENIRKKRRGKANKLRDQKLRAKAHLYGSSTDEEEEDKRAPELLEQLEQQVKTDDGEEVEFEWGHIVFGEQLETPVLTHGVSPNLQRALQASKAAGRETSLEEFAGSGFLRSWALCMKRCDESTLRWAYHQMAYSSQESVERATCKFLCNFVSRIAPETGVALAMDWLPSLTNIKQTLSVYGYKERSEDVEPMDSPSESGARSSVQLGLRKNLRSVLEFLAACFVSRNVQPFYTLEDVEKLLVIMVHLTLERQLLAILYKVQDCIIAMVRCFSDQEWVWACPRVAADVSKLTTKPQNGMYVLGAIAGLGKRALDLQRRVALHEFTNLTQKRKLLTTPREVAETFKDVNLKAKVIDFEKLYHQMVLADAFLWCHEDLGYQQSAWRMWVKFLQRCSKQIYIGDERAFATKLRNLASFLVQKYEHEGNVKEPSPERAVVEEFE